MKLPHLGNKGKLTRKWAMPGSPVRVFLDGGGSAEAALHFDPETFQLYTRVPYLPTGDLLVGPATPEGRKDLEARVQDALRTLLADRQADADDGREWSRVILLNYTPVQVVTPDWRASGRTRASTRKWDRPPWYTPRTSSVTKWVTPKEAEAMGFEVSRQHRRWSRGVPVPLSEAESHGRGSDVLGPLLIARVEVSYDPEWFDKHDPNGSMVGRQDPRTPRMHLREWEEDYTARCATWEAEAGRSERDQKARPVRHRKAESSPLSLRVLPWVASTWDDLLAFQETIRSVDRRLRRFLLDTDDALLLGRLSQGLLLSAGDSGNAPTAVGPRREPA